MSKEVLVIDHDPLVRNLISNLLVLKNYQPHQAAGRDEAMVLLEQHHHQLIILDLMLPDENGFHFLQWIRDQYPRQAAHLVATTVGDPKFVARIPHEGICATLVKPFSISEFYRIIELCEGGGHASGYFYN
jgi:DNA-binding response OmpR family regulator